MELSDVQTVLVPRRYSLVRARELVRSYGLIPKKVDVTPNFYRFRQFDPRPGDRYHTLKMGDGVELVFARK